MRSTIVAITMLATVAACHKAKDQAPPAAPAKAAAATARPKPAGPKINQPVEDAMTQIPPELRVSFQSALACEVKSRPKGAKAIDITPDFIRGLTAKLKADPSIAKC